MDFNLQWVGIVLGRKIGLCTLHYEKSIGNTNVTSTQWPLHCSIRLSSTTAVRNDPDPLRPPPRLASKAVAYDEAA